MPAAAAVWVGTWVVGALGATTAAVVAGVAAMGLTYVGVVVGISYALSAASSALMGRPRGSGGARYREMTVKSPVAPRAIVYGEATIGGVVTYQATTGLANEYLDIVIALAGHQIEEIGDVWLDDIRIPKAEINSGNAAGGAVGGAGQYRVRDGQTFVWIYKYLGTDGQSASSVLSATDGTGYGPTVWTSDHKGRSVAYAHIRFRRSQKVFANGAPSNFRFRVKGARVYDPRLDTTNGGAGSHRLADATTWAYSANVALCAADYIAGGTLVNDVATPVRRRGFAVPTPATNIDWPSVISAANECDESVSIPATSQVRYELGGLLAPSDASPDADCMDQLLSSMLGQVTCPGGVYRIYAGAYATPTYTLTENDLAGPIKVVTTQGRSERYNTVRGSRFDLVTGSNMEFVSRQDTGYVSDDGRALYRDIELPMTNNEFRAQRIAQLILRRSREMQTLIWPGQLSALKIGIWETVSVTVAELGISAKVYRCINRVMRPTTDGHDPIVELTLREEFSSTYNDPATGDYDDPTVGADPGPSTPILDAPTGLTATSSLFSIRFTITPSVHDSADTLYDIYEHTSSTPFSSAVLISSASATDITVQKSDTTTRYYWVRARRGDAVSTNYPSGAGVAGTIVDDGTGIIPDPHFERATDGTYWHDAFGPTTGYSLSLTGGVVGGRMILVGNSTAKEIFSRRSPPMRTVTTQQYKAYIRYRRTGTLTGTGDALYVNGFTTDSDALGTTANCTGTLTITIAAANAATVNEWQESSVTITVGNRPKNATQLPFIIFRIYQPTAVTGGTIEVDALIVTAI